jgi:putative lipoprotein
MKPRRALALAAPIALLCTLAAPAVHAEPPRPVDPFFGRDKALHFSACAVFAGAGYGAAALGGMHDRADRAVMGASVAIGVGLTKEVLDAAGLGTPSWKDFAWDVLGTLAGLGVSLTVDYAFTPRRPAAIAR